MSIPLKTRQNRSQAVRSVATACQELGRQTLELLLPSTCRLCDRCVSPGADFCDACSLQLGSSESLMQFACRRCGRPGAGRAVVGGPQTVASPAPSQPAASTNCLHCKREKLAFDDCVALWTYHGLVRSAVVAAKYGSQTALADALGRRLGQRILDTLDPTGPPDQVTSVPSHLWRRMQRGGGGSRALAAAVARKLASRWPLAASGELLATTRRIQKQAWLGDQQRLDNVRGAFRMKSTRGSLFRWLPPHRAVDLSGQHVLLIDDVMTTGATSSEIARTLKSAGANRVTVAVVARAYAG
ncbi:hypothetical protein NHH03_13235 [Stieleria sp. TO1_6]|uniref:ComF family protein n=1 Tax=Stieleria tagensis TaxID=2956795 RepID=UPI00209B57BA|nr:phosphoribosyltransferase family protein [Stieleria tagensis]MCO8122705.1 hypothetical protein [Stieleria tagensis]